LDLSVCIKELLFKYNCVIIPGFGAFVLNYEPSHINAITNTFTPPSKNIIFNPSVNRNDGLLADYISGKMNSTFDEAVLILRDSVEDLKITLNKGKKIYFKDIGLFTVNREGSYQFETEEKVNFYPESFGLTSCHSPSIIREGIARRIEKKIKEKDYEHKDRRIITPVGWAAAASIMLITLLAWTVLRTDMIKNVNQSYAGIFNTLVSRIYNNDLIRTESNVPIVIYKPKTIISQPAKTNDILPTPESQHETLNMNLAKRSHELANKHETYYIIGGCFSIEDNAKKFLEQLKSKGYNPVIIGKTKTGLIRVSYSSFDNIEQANKELSSIHSSQNSGAWLLHISNH
jgi:hypothetical protein